MKRRGSTRIKSYTDLALVTIEIALWKGTKLRRIQSLLTTSQREGLAVEAVESGCRIPQWKWIELFLRVHRPPVVVLKLKSSHLRRKVYSSRHQIGGFYNPKILQV